MSLIGYWPLNEASGTAYDYSGNEYHGSVNGGVTQGDNGPLAEDSYGFNGSDGYVSSSESMGISGSDPVSISAWAKASSSTGWQMLAGFHRGQNAGNHFALAITGQDEWGVHGWSDGDFDSGVTPDSNWHHLTAVYDGSQLRFYIDGVEAPNSPFNYTYSIQSTKMFFGVEEERLDHWYSGNLSEVRLYDRPLTESEIQYLYNVGSRGLQVTGRKSS
ncbi:LamG domain-containing protein [Candidatus Nanosalina sp. VS9-1]|uniref:LamG domain-containing protein n=1 Tax=Candidatus Nanosalina sp. VS9-1 TaxID=3388566 RepID=UPI0039DF467C